mmetsp:Transcript_48152/g.154234  ORF Transcript_48152/g.154234 Transcript_48152/m.154234 type:complete len:218 (-) Transcript_48152:4164-4817(-)
MYLSTVRTARTAGLSLGRWPRSHGPRPRGDDLGCGRELCLHPILEQGPHVVNVLHQGGLANLATCPLRFAGRLLHLEAQLPRSLSEAGEDWCQLEAILKEPEASEHIQPVPRTAHRHDDTPHIPEMANMIRPHERDNDEVVLLTLEPVHSGDLARLTEERIPSTPLANDITDERLLAVVRRQDGDLVGWVAEQTHVHEERHAVFGLAQILIEVRCRL